MCKCGNQLFKSFLSIVVVAISIGMLEFCCGKKEQNPVLAKFDGGTVLENEYVDHYLLSTKYKPEVFPTEENLKEIVTKKALEKMAVKEALAKGLDKDSTYQETVRRQTSKIVFYRYMQKEMISKVITDSLIKEFYDHYSPQYHLRYIIRPVVKTSTPQFERTQKDTIEFVYRLLKSGKKFEDLANKYSQDITTNQKGGDLGFVIRESLGDEQLRAVMDTLRDFTYSRPFRGYEGYYILYKGEKRIVPVPPLEQVKDKIWKTLYRTRRHRIQQQVDKRFAMLKEKYHYQFFENVRSEILAKAGADASTLAYQLLNFSGLDDGDRAKVLARYDGGAISVAELFEDRKREPEYMREFDDRFTEIAEQHLLAKHALELGLQNDAEIVAQIALMKESLLRSNLMQQMIMNQVEAKVDSLKSALASQLKSEELKSTITKKRFEIEKELKQQFDAEMMEKYRFRFVVKNFPSSLEKARLRKEEQNQKTAKEKDGNKQTR